MRPIRQIGLALSAWGLFAAAPAAGQSDAESARSEFEAAAGAHRENVRRLGVTRALSSPIRSERLLPGGEAASSTPTLANVTRWIQSRVTEGAFPADTYVLFYAHREGRLSAWLIGADGIAGSAGRTLSQEALAETISNLMGALDITERQLTRAARPIEEAPPTLSAPSAMSPETANARLSSTLFPDAILAGLRRVRHLVVVPTGEIGIVPFNALNPFGDGTQVVDHFSVSIAPSLQALSKPASAWNPSRAFAAPLVVGDPRLPPSSGWLVPPLTGAQAEAREVGAFLNSTPLLAELATRGVVLERAGSASLLYLATHGTANPIDPVGGGFLMLGAQTFEQGWWTARDIQASTMTAQLAVLSACQTGLGKSHEGGMIGLARAFQLAGVPRVVMSLWNVDDSATRHLMTRFIRYAAEHRPAEALRRAMRDTRAEYPHPAYWSSFLLFGEAS
ncbi:MAG TPA: CHAT domain-containing protein [Allosphingosinicella sp.]|nr:CHAT domain-containing protein [Allosphingosinicella sp.]